MNADPGEEDVLEGGGAAASCESASEEEKDALRWWVGDVGEGGEEDVCFEIVAGVLEVLSKLDSLL